MAASAPGKLILFGEHAVVFGEPALSTAINLRAEVYARPHSEWRGGRPRITDPPQPKAKEARAKGEAVRPPGAPTTPRRPPRGAVCARRPAALAPAPPVGMVAGRPP